MDDTGWQPRILLVEDNPVNRALMSRKLRQAGYETVMLAKNGREALELALDHQPDLILMDMRLPEMSGTEVIEVLREKDYQGPIIVVSADASGADVSCSLRAGANDHIKKPVDFEDLFRRMARLLKSDKNQPIPDSRDVTETEEVLEILEAHEMLETQESLKSSEDITETEEVREADPEIKPEIKKEYKIEDSFSDEVKMVFISDAKEKMAIIEEAFENDRFEERLERLKAVAHEYKGTAPIFGLKALGAAAGELDAGFKNNDPIPRLKDLARELLAHIKNVLQSNF